MTDSIESDRVHAARRARREAPARGGRPTTAQRYALEFAVTRLDGAIPFGTNRRTADVLAREGWITVAPYRITDAGRAAIGEPTTAAVQTAADRDADDARHADGCRSWLDGDPYCDCDDAAPADDRPAHIIAEELGLPVDAITPGPNDVPGADWTNPLPPRRTPDAADAADADDECERCECTGTITVHVDDDHGGYDGSRPCPDCTTATDYGTRGRRASVLLGSTATRASAVLGYDVDPDGDDGRALCQGYADETGEPVAIYALPYGADRGTGPIECLPYVGTFQPRVTGPCWDGRSYAGVEPDACTSRATTTVPASVWAPGSTAEYPTNVPACAACAREVWAADAAAGARAEARATMSDALT